MSIFPLAGPDTHFGVFLPKLAVHTLATHPNADGGSGKLHGGKEAHCGQGLVYMPPEFAALTRAIMNMAPFEEVRVDI